MEIKQDILTLFFGRETVIYNNHVFPTGTLACQALNIPHDDVDRIAELSLPLLALAQGLQSQICPPELLEPAKTSAHEIIHILTAHAPFNNLDENLLRLGIDAMFVPLLLEAHDRIYGIIPKNTEADLIAAHGLMDISLRFIRILEHLGYSLGQYLDTFEIFAEHLDQLSNRKIDGLADTVAILFPRLISIHDGKAWMTGATLANHYLPVKDKNGSSTIGRCNYYQTIVGLLRADLFEGLAVGHAPKKCLNCGRWFLTLDGRHTKYCDGIDPNSEKGESCRSVGNRKRKEFREKAEDNHYKKLYTTRCNSIRARKRRDTLDPQIAEKALILAKNKLNRVVQDNDYALNYYEAEMELDVLIAEATREVENVYT